MGTQIQASIRNTHATCWARTAARERHEPQPITTPTSLLNEARPHLTAYNSSGDTHTASTLTMAAYTPSNDIPSYTDHRASGSFDPNVPPKPPPKPRSEDVSRQSTPVLSQFSQQPSPLGGRPSPQTPERPLYAEQVGPQGAPQAIPDPGPNWLPKILEDKSYAFSLYLHKGLAAN